MPKESICFCSGGQNFWTKKYQILNFPDKKDQKNKSPKYYPKRKIGIKVNRKEIFRL